MHCTETEPTAHVTSQQEEEVAASNKGKASAVVGDVLLLRCYCYLVAIAAVVLSPGCIGPGPE
jgi:hypothetical protein